MAPDNPLSQVLAVANPISALRLFPRHLKNQTLYNEFKTGSRSEPNIRKGLGSFLQKELYKTIQSEAFNSHLSALVPMESRKAPTLRFADISLAAPVADQDLLLRYRQGIFMFNSICACGPSIKFHRGHEGCPKLTQAPLLDSSTKEGQS